MEIHPIYLPENDSISYKEAVNTPETDDNAISHGCINTAEIGAIKDNINIGNSVVYITSNKKSSQ